MLFLGERDMNRVSGRDAEALERVARHRRLRLALELDERDVGSPGDQTHLRSEPRTFV